MTPTIEDWLLSNGFKLLGNYNINLDEDTNSQLWYNKDNDGNKVLVCIGASSNSVSIQTNHLTKIQADFTSKLEDMLEAIKKVKTQVDFINKNFNKPRVT